MDIQSHMGGSGSTLSQTDFDSMLAKSSDYAKLAKSLDGVDLSTIASNVSKNTASIKTINDTLSRGISTAVVNAINDSSSPIRKAIEDEVDAITKGNYVMKTEMNKLIIRGDDDKIIIGGSTDDPAKSVQLGADAKSPIDLTAGKIQGNTLEANKMIQLYNLNVDGKNGTWSNLKIQPDTTNRYNTVLTLGAGNETNNLTIEGNMTLATNKTADTPSPGPVKGGNLSVQNLSVQNPVQNLSVHDLTASGTISSLGSSGPSNTPSPMTIKGGEIKNCKNLQLAVNGNDGDNTGTISIHYGLASNFKADGHGNITSKGQITSKGLITGDKLTLTTYGDPNDSHCPAAPIQLPNWDGGQQFPVISSNQNGAGIYATMNNWC